MAGESELHRLIRYGCLFELELKQMAEMETLRAENSRLRRKLRRRKRRAG